jgi:ribosomal-protein-alanine N-acetyltransferase
MKLENPSLKLITFSTPLLQALAKGRYRFEQESSLKTVSDWPNHDFIEAIPYFLKGRADLREEKWSFLIVRDNCQVIGEIGSKGPPSNVGEIEVGYGIAPSCQRMGYATFALEMFIQLAFQTAGITAVTAECLAINRNSIRVLEKNNFRTVGTRASGEGLLLVWRLEK